MILYTKAPTRFFIVALG